MKTSAEIKQLAKNQISGNIGTLFLIALIIAVVTYVVALIPVVGLVVGTFIIAPAFSLSTARIYIRLTRGTSPVFGDISSGFDDFWSSFKVTFLTFLYISLWSLLFLIPGIVKSFSYSMAYYILAENPGMGGNEAITRSRNMMEGHKMELFCLYLSFFGWFILGIFTFGIAFIYIIPYMNAAQANFYQNLKPARSMGTDTSTGSFDVSQRTFSDTSTPSGDAFGGDSSGNNDFPDFDLPSNDM